MSKDEINYSRSYVAVDREKIVHSLQSELSPHRFQHCLRVEETARRLAEKYGQDKEKAGLAGLLHDYAKEASKETLLSYQEHPDYDPDWLNYGNAIWHGPLAAMRAVDQFGLKDEEIYQAIFNHTVGSLKWTPTAKIVYLADYIEPGRDFPEVEEARQATERSLDEGVTYKLTHSLTYLVNNHLRIYPRTLEVYNQWFGDQEKKI